jgi:hypothetical protein
MVSHDVPIKTSTPSNEQGDRSNEQRDRFEWSGERRFDVGGPVVDKVDARQGVTGHNVRYVLLFGLLGVIVAFAAILAFDVYR